MLAHFADQLGDGIPIIFATGFVELLDIVGGLYWVGLYNRAVSVMDTANAAVS